jgi:hypothetical protein
MQYIKLIVQNRIIPMKKPIIIENFSHFFLFAVIVIKQLIKGMNLTICACLQAAGVILLMGCKM